MECEKTCLNCMFEPDWYPATTAFDEYCGICRWWEYKQPKPLAICFDDILYNKIPKSNPYRNCPAWVEKRCE